MSDGDDRSIPIEYKLIRDALLLDTEIVESDVKPTVGDEDWSVRVQLQVDEDILETCAHGLILAIGVLSFHDGRPRGVSGEWFEDDDQFTAADMLNHLRFEHGKLHMYVDYLRGRCIKTTVEIGSDGKVRLETVNRGKAALTWVGSMLYLHDGDESGSLPRDRNLWHSRASRPRVGQDAESRRARVRSRGALSLPKRMHRVDQTSAPV